jgi:hypothetical protein
MAESVQAHFASVRARAISIALLAAIGCRPARTVPPPATADQTVREAMMLVCETPARADADRGAGVSRSDAIALHLTDGIGNDRVLTVVELWKTDGIRLAELEALLDEAGLSRCPLRDTAR